MTLDIITLTIDIYGKLPLPNEYYTLRPGLTYELEADGACVFHVVPDERPYHHRQTVQYNFKKVDTFKWHVNEPGHHLLI